ncbi:retinitis pigmentosa 1-like 1 protein [Nycticebus coucang]|uniref:retinitis pigmentosa 1-like 1 protein n=1 Tax=Nycticebus coucang TaxID=9470 RepID=UPI00234CB8C3|nr:retinitis pigmentosa 1-like 1 protein [Nycticebus coucang]
MNSAPTEAQAPGHRECLLPSVARTPSVTQVTPAKKITFLKRGDPQFAGVRLAVHQRAFKTFSALMDELSQRVPLSFGVRSVTTPRGLHGLSALEQLEDGGCYLCSDKKAPKTPSGPGQPQGRSPSVQQSWDFEGQREAPGTSSSWKGPKAPRKILLVKNRDPRVQQMVTLSQRDTRTLAAFLSKASDLLHFPVKQIYTMSGRQVDSMQTLPRSTSVLVCASNEAFRPLAVEDARKNGTETLAGLTAKNKNGSWGPKAKRSVIHARSRSRSGSRPRRSSLLSEQSRLSDPPASLNQAWVGPVPNRRPQDMPTQASPLVASDGMKKKVRMNEDGSLSVEMKVRFHLCGQDTLLWSRRAGKASGEGPDLGEADPLCCVWEGHPVGCSVPGVWGPGPCGAGCEEVCGQSGPSRPRYEIWTNPLHTAQGKGLASRRKLGLTQHPGCRGPSSQGATIRERPQDSISSPSSSGPSEGSEPDSSCCPRTPEGGVGSSGLSAQSGARREADPCPEAAGLGSWGAKGALPDSLAGARSLQGGSKCCGQHQGHSGEAGAVTSQRKFTQGSGPGPPTLSPSSLKNEDLQAETCGQGTGCCNARWESVTRLPLAPGHSGSWDTEGSSPTPPTFASAQQGTRNQRTQAQSLLHTPGLGRVAQRGHTRQCHHCLLDSPAAQPTPRPPNQGRSCPERPEPQVSESSSSTQTQASRDLRALCSGSLHYRDFPGASSATVSPASKSDYTSGSCHCDAPSAGGTGEAGSRAGSLPPSPPHTPQSCSQARAGGQREEAEDTPEPSTTLALQVGWPERGEQGHCCSQFGAPPVQGAPSGNTRALWAPSPEAHWAGSRYCPTPPREKRPPSCSSGSFHSAVRGPAGSQQREESPAVGCTLTPGPRGPSQEKTAMGGGGPEEREDCGGVTPGALPQASPDAMVREWLDNIPEEPVLMNYEMADEAARVARDGPGSPREDPGDGRSPEGPGVLAQIRPQSPEGDAGENLEAAGALLGAGSAGLSSGECPPQGAALGRDPKAPVEAREGGGVVVGSQEGQRRLPARVSASTQILKVLMGFKQGRPSSLPEVSSPVARRLSHSAGALVTCLARLHFLDEDLGSPTGKVKFTDSPQYQELLSISRTLWPGCNLGQDQADLGLQELTWSQALQGLGSHAGTENLTPTSSSGVDLSSGSGGSGEGSVPCAMDCTLGPERGKLPQETFHQRPDSRASEEAECLGHPQKSCSPASPNSPAPSEGRVERDGREPGLGSDPGQAVGNATQQEGAHLEKIGGEIERQEEGTKEEGLPGEGRAGSQGWAGASCPGREGSPGEEGAKEEEDAPVVGRGELTEPPGQLSERDPDVTAGQSGPRFAPILEKLPGAARTGQEQTQALLPLGARERSTLMAGRASLDPDRIWVSAMLKKMEKAFLAHLTSAVAELRARWSLQDHPLLDQMAAELQQDMGRRLQGSTQRELRKIQSRAGRGAPGPPREALRGELSLQTEQRRRCFRDLHNFSVFSQRTQGLGTLSLEDRPALGAALGTRLGREAEGEEFCPCEACMKKKVSPVSSKGLVGITRAPIKEAFDLQQILQKRGGHSSGDAAEVTPEKTGTEPLQEDPSSPQPSQGADDGLGLELGPGVQGEDSQRCGRDDCPEPEGTEGAGLKEGGEDAAAQRGEGNSLGAAEREQDRNQGPGDKGSLEDEAPAGADQILVGQRDGAEGEGEGRPGSAGETQGDRGGSPRVSPEQDQSEEASQNSSLDQEGRSIPPPTPGGDTPRQNPGPSSSRPSCLGSCSQKGSEDGTSGDIRNTEAESQEISHAERKVIRMYPESSTSEQEGAPSCPRTPEQRASEGSDLQDEESATRPLFPGEMCKAHGKRLAKGTAHTMLSLVLNSEASESPRACPTHRVKESFTELTCYQSRAVWSKLPMSPCHSLPIGLPPSWFREFTGYLLWLDSIHLRLLKAVTQVIGVTSVDRMPSADKTGPNRELCTVPDCVGEGLLGADPARPLGTGGSLSGWQPVQSDQAAKTAESPAQGLSLSGLLLGLFLTSQPLATFERSSQQRPWEQQAVATCTEGWKGPSWVYNSLAAPAPLAQRRLPEEGLGAQSPARPLGPANPSSPPPAWESPHHQLIVPLLPLFPCRIVPVISILHAAAAAQEGEAVAQAALAGPGVLLGGAATQSARGPVPASFPAACFTGVVENPADGSGLGGAGSILVSALG